MSLVGEFDRRERRDMKLPRDIAKTAVDGPRRKHTPPLKDAYTGANHTSPATTTGSTTNTFLFSSPTRRFSPTRVRRRCGAASCLLDHLLAATRPLTLGKVLSVHEIERSFQLRDGHSHGPLEPGEFSSYQILTDTISYYQLLSIHHMAVVAILLSHGPLEPDE